MANQFPLPTPSQIDEPLPVPGVTLPPPEETPVIPPSYEPPQPIATVPIKSSPFKIIIPVAIGLAVVGLIIFVISRVFAGLTPSTPKTAPNQTINLNYWGLWESSATMKPVIDAFEKDNPGIKVNYQLQSHQDYQDRLLTAVAGQNSPDVSRIHASWLPVFINNLVPSPANTISTTEVQTNFYPVVGNSVVVNGQVYGIPLTMDGLVLFLNTNMLQQANVQPPTTWEELRSIAQVLTVRDPATEKITRAGVALGNTINVTHWPDIVSLMLIQGGVNLLNPDVKATSETISYYTSFAGVGKYWDETMPDSIIAFANEKVAMIFAPLWNIPDIQAINSNLIWQMAPIPQLPDSDPVSWNSMWIEVVPKNSSHPKEAWKFVSFLASAKAQQILFESVLKERGSAEVPANKAISSLASQNPLAAVLVGGADISRTFYTVGHTRDSTTGLNSRLIKYLEDAVNAVSTRQDPSKAVQTMSLGFNQVLSQYRLVAPLSSASPTP